MARTTFNHNTSAELFKAVLSKKQSDEIGKVVDESIELAARLREERAERDRIEREAKERAERLRYFQELEAEDAKRLKERETLEEKDRLENEAERDREKRAQAIAEMRRADQLWA